MYLAPNLRLAELDLVLDIEVQVLSSLVFLWGLTSILFMGTPIVMAEFIILSLDISSRSLFTSFLIISVLLSWSFDLILVSFNCIFNEWIS